MSQLKTAKPKRSTKKKSVTVWCVFWKQKLRTGLGSIHLTEAQANRVVAEIKKLGHSETKYHVEQWSTL